MSFQIFSSKIVDHHKVFKKNSVKTLWLHDQEPLPFPSGYSDSPIKQAPEASPKLFSI